MEFNLVDLIRNLYGTPQARLECMYIAQQFTATPSLLTESLSYRLYGERLPNQTATLTLTIALFAWNGNR